MPQPFAAFGPADVLRDNGFAMASQAALRALLWFAITIVQAVLGQISDIRSPGREHLAPAIDRDLVIALEMALARRRNDAERAIAQIFAAAVVKDDFATAVGRFDAAQHRAQAI